MRERGRRAVRKWTAVAALLGLGATGVASVGTFIAIEQASGTTTTTGSTASTGTSSSTTSSGTTSSSTSSSGVSSGSGSSVTSSSGS